MKRGRCNFRFRLTGVGILSGLNSEDCYLCSVNGFGVLYCNSCCGYAHVYVCALQALDKEKTLIFVTANGVLLPYIKHCAKSINRDLLAYHNINYNFPNLI